jgi:hypothetical protein
MTARCSKVLADRPAATADVGLAPAIETCGAGSRIRTGHQASRMRAARFAAHYQAIAMAPHGIIYEAVIPMVVWHGAAIKIVGDRDTGG